MIINAESAKQGGKQRPWAEAWGRCGPYNDKWDLFLSHVLLMIKEKEEQLL